MDNIAAEYDDCETAYAKINLALHVRRRLANGYHDIETVFAFLDRGDRLFVRKADRLGLTITGSFADGLSTTDNLVLRAANLLAEQSGRSANAQLLLEKNLPIASGIGGGSADAAATLRMLNRQWNCGYSVVELAELSKPLGADIPACVLSETSRGEGIGQQVEPINNGGLQTYYVLLANPLYPVSTAEVFAAWQEQDRGGLVGEYPIEIALSGRNDLQEPACQIAPVISELLDYFKGTNAVISRMAGSGATCFGVFKTRAEAEETEIHLLSKFPGFWTMTGCFR